MTNKHTKVFNLSNTQINKIETMMSPFISIILAKVKNAVNTENQRTMKSSEGH